MTDTGFLYVLITGTALLLFAIVCVVAHYKRPEPVKKSNPIVGYVTGVREDETGIFVTGKLNDEGVKLFPGDTISWQSLALGATPDGRIESVAIVHDPRPCKGKNGNICVAEGCYGEACRNG